MRIAVCDDDAAFLQNTVQLIRKWSKERGIPAEICPFDNGDALIAANAARRFEVIFLDILMPLLGGMDAARELRQHDTAVCILFLTASPEFALESYEVKAQGYLLKPVSYEKLQAALDECAAVAAAQPKHLIVHTPYGYQKVYYHTIAYIEAQNKHVYFHLISGETVVSIEPLYTFEKALTVNEGFFKCHRSYLVYMPHIEHFDAAQITTSVGAVPIARGLAKPFKDAYFTLMFRDGEVSP